MKYVLLVVAGLQLGAVLAGSNANCSDHGFNYQLEEGGTNICQCFQCYVGDMCQNVDPSCSLETRVAEATVFQDWFVNQVGAALDITISAKYHAGYLKSPRVFPPNSMPNDPSFDAISRQINSSIRALHRKVQNVDDAEFTLVVGAGGVQLIDAALYALTQGENIDKSMNVYAEAPYYPHFEMASSLNPLTNFTQDIEPACSTKSLIEVVTSPNNPTGRVVRPHCQDSYRITDYVYNWPHYASSNVTPRTDDIMIFSLSKLTGYAASRIGWAFVKDPKIADIMSNYMWLQSTAPAIESQLRAVKVLTAMTNSIGTDNDFFKYSRSKLDQRWSRLRTLFATQERFELDCSDGNLFMWIKCMNGNDQSNCAKPFETVGITTETGVNYGSGTDHVRICMGHHDSTFELLVQRLRSLFRSSDKLLSTNDLKRAQTKTPRNFALGDDFASMSRNLNSILKRKYSSIMNLRECPHFSLTDLHDIQKKLHDAREFSLQEIYLSSEDPRALAFGRLDLNLKGNMDFEMFHASKSDSSSELIQRALCHRIVMQFVHHLTESQRQSLKDLSLPLLPDSEPSTLTLATATPDAQIVYDNATKCIVCHQTSSDSSTISPSSPLPEQPYVPPWPRHYDVRFGLTTSTLKNVSSHMYFDVDVPSMHIHHDHCAENMFPTMPDINGPCNLTFLHDGLWLIWKNASSSVPACCNLVNTDMTSNLGLNELGGFEFVRNTTAVNYFNETVNAELWTNGPTLQPPTGFGIYIDPETYEDVFYHNGGTYFLQWQLAHRNFHKSDKSVFELPDNPNCNVKCQKTDHEQIMNSIPALRALRTKLK